MTPPISISTGSLPPPELVRRLLAEAHHKFRQDGEGKVAEYIPALAKVDPDLFGIAVVGVSGRTFTAGDSSASFTIQSVSKPFAFALVCDVLGAEEARTKLGVNSTGLAFDSLLAVEVQPTRTANPMVNAGAIATSILAPGDTLEEKWEFIRSGLGRFAGRELVLDEEVYESESVSNGRNRGVAHILAGYRRLGGDPEEAVDLYTRQCSLLVTAEDLAAMGATLANGGTNPLTNDPVIAPEICQRVLAVMTTAGVYELSGEWVYDIGVPAKSGVGGGIVVSSPGKGGLGVFSPPLDTAGNSVRGQQVALFLSEGLGLNLYASRPA
jgi:glutaminase